MAESDSSASQQGYKRILRNVTIAIGGLLILVACSKPLYDMVRKPHDQRWERALVAEENKRAAAASAAGDRSLREARDFGKELDVLTSFYETVISILLTVLAMVAGLAFWTIKVVTRAQAEETATEAAARILGNHDGFRERLAEVVDNAVELRMEEVNAKLEEFSVPLDMAVQNPDQAVGSKPQATKVASKATKKATKKVTKAPSKKNEGK